MQQQFSIEEMQSQIRDLQLALNTPGIPDDEAQMHRALIARIQAEIRARGAQQGPVTLPPEPSPAQPIKHTAPPIPKPPTNNNNAPLSPGEGQIVRPRVIAPAAVPKNRVLNASVIQADHQADPYNPVLTITWDDGYTFTGDETSIRGRFTSTLRDTVALRYAQERKFEKIWRWDTPWRAAGLLKALNYLNPDKPLSLRDLGINRPADLMREVFELIAAAANEKVTG